MGVTAGILTGAGALFGGAGDIISAQKSAEATRDKAEFQASGLEFNADLKDISAKETLRRGEKTAFAFRRAAEVFRDEQTIGFLGQGVDVTRGTVASIQRETGAKGELGAIEIANDARLQAFGLKTEAFDLRSQAAIARVTGEQIAEATLLTGGFSAITRILSAGGKIAGQGDS